MCMCTHTHKDTHTGRHIPTFQHCGGDQGRRITASSSWLPSKTEKQRMGWDLNQGWNPGQPWSSQPEQDMDTRPRRTEVSAPAASCPPPHCSRNAGCEGGPSQAGSHPAWRPSPTHPPPFPGRARNEQFQAPQIPGPASTREEAENFLTAWGGGKGHVWN